MKRTNTTRGINKIQEAKARGEQITEEEQVRLTEFVVFTL